MFFNLSLKSINILTVLGLITTPMVIFAPPSYSQERQIITAEQRQELIATSEQILSLINAGQYAAALDYLVPESKDYITPEQIKAIWENEIIAKDGAFEEVVTAKVIDVVNADIVILNARFANISENIQFIYNKEQQLIGFGVPSKQSIDAIVTSFINNLATGEYGLARRYFSPLFKTEIFPAKLEEEWQIELNQYGKFKGIKDIVVRPGVTLSEPDLAIVTLEFEQSTNDYFILFDNQTAIINIDFVTD
ncbi:MULTISPECIES: DUF3887 domain-containing protein [Synechocystis]|uniref:DUF3887 domain-containing protein n=1 Tax=Synechocystis salina LEGE 00031 TaxID=1828736 RepID=A0ABR9VVM3_9SYNC|nr:MULTISPECIES: DUF3887 domain-containing protein [Synechocystis]MBE9242296.1 DUF3887 domain-containing protein [Synechocystis salina LEGE 00041]MBE9255405.1 DUF3887 domain-containing protein [Synechocystis salina LEGE 00031]